MNKSVFANRLKNLRESKGMSQKDLAKLLKRSIQTISNWETEMNFPNLQTFDELCSILDTSSDYMLGRDNQKTVSVKGLSEEAISDLIRVIEHMKAK